MARANTRTLLPLDRFFSIIGMHPLHANQIYLENLAVCQTPILQYNWQSGSERTSREDVAQAISMAEDTLATKLGFRLALTWEVDERHQTYIGNGLPLNSRPSVRTTYGYVFGGGVEAKTVIATGRPIVYSDGDGDGYKETATITATTTVTDPDEIALFYPGKIGDDAWEVRPITVSILGGTVTIVCQRHQLLKEALLESLSATSQNGLTDDNFLTTVDVFRRWHDDRQQVQMLWASQYGACDCGSDVCPLCTLVGQFGCMTVRDTKLGILSYEPAIYDEALAKFAASAYTVSSRHPDRLRLWYRAGYGGIRMKDQWARAVAYLALTYLVRPVCDCTNVESAAEYWRTDMAVSTATEQRRISTRLLDNPFGTSRAALYVWNLVKEEWLV